MKDARETVARGSCIRKRSVRPHLAVAGAGPIVRATGADNAASAGTASADRTSVGKPEGDQPRDDAGDSR